MSSTCNKRETKVVVHMFTCAKILASECQLKLLVTVCYANLTKGVS